MSIEIGRTPPWIAVALAVLACEVPPPVPVETPAPPPQPIVLEPCRLPGFDDMLADMPAAPAERHSPKGDGRCGSYQVWEDREGKTGRKIPLRIAVLPARAEKPEPDPLLVILGGPGSSVVNSPWVALFFDPVRERRDVLLIDQRGTGGSNPLTCDPPGSDDDLQGYLDPMLPPELVERCRERLAEQADPRFYTTAHAVDDFEEVRVALGYGPVNLWGGSYGTQAVQVYLKRHPASVRSAVMFGPSPLDQKNPLAHAPGGQRALDLIFAACAANEACAAAHPDPRADLETVLRRLEEGPVKVEIDHPARAGEKVTLELHRGVFAETLRAMTYDLGRGVRVPAHLRRAAEGDLSRFVTFALRREREGLVEGESWFTGMFLSVTCAEGLAFITDREIAETTAGTFLGDYRLRRQRAACARWPVAEVSPLHLELPRADVPALLISGHYDPVTPPDGARRIAHGLPRSRLVVVQNMAHGFGNSFVCVSEVVADFVAAGVVDDLDVSCLEAIEMPELATQ